jgi:tetratricopeptide (TPR) repeat protein
LDHAQGDYEGMLRNAGRALEIAREISHPRGMGLSLAEIALAHAEMKNYQQAMLNAKNAIDIIGGSSFGDRWRAFFALGRAIMINQKYKAHPDPLLIKKAEEAFLEAMEILDDARKELDLSEGGNLLRYSQISESNSAPAKELIKLWQKTGDHKKARLLAKEWFLKI